MRRILGLVLLLFFVAPSALAADAGQLLRESAQAQPTGNFIQTVRLTSTSKSGKEKVRELVMKTRGSQGNLWVRGDVTAPEGMAGTRFALTAVAGEKPQMMVYLPAVGTLMHMSGDKRRGSFLGTDFSFEDLAPIDLDTAEHTLVEETDKAWVIDTVPLAESDATYGRVRTTLSKADRLPRRVLYFDAKGRQVKELVVLDVTDQGGRPMLTRLEMRDLVKGSKTVMEVLEVRLDVPDEELPDALFSSEGLKAG
jgi:hypothetical protein